MQFAKRDVSRILLAVCGIYPYSKQIMENLLRQTLIDTAVAFAHADGCALSNVSRRVKNDPNFFSRLSDTSKSFTARSFDEVMRWCADNWPQGKQMPLGLMKWIAETNYEVAA